MRQNMNRSRWIFAAFVVVLVVALLNPALAGKPDRNNILEVDIIGINATEPFDILPSPIYPGFGGPFYTGGTIVDPDSGLQIGLFHCWGFFFGGDFQRMVTQEFDIFDRGKIILTGREGPAGEEGAGGSPRAITGGTGDFKNVRGQATFSGPMALLHVTFELDGAKDGR